MALYSPLCPCSSDCISSLCYFASSWTEKYLIWFDLIWNVMRKQVNYHPLNSIYGPYGGRLRPLYVGYTKFESDSSIRSKVIRSVPKFGNWTIRPRPRPLRDQFVFLMQEGFFLYLCTKFEVDSLIRLKITVIRMSQNFEIGSRDPKPRLFEP